MKNPDTTLDSLAILCLDGKTEDLEEGIYFYKFTLEYNLLFFNIIFLYIMNYMIFKLKLSIGIQ